MQIVLKRGSLTALADTMGGELVSLRDAAGTEYIWEGDPAYWSGRNPILFPIVGGLKDGTVRIGGKPYQMDRHGFARRMEFSVVGQGDDYAELELGETAEVCIQAICRDYGLSREKARGVFENVWIYTFGVGTLCARGMCRFSQEEVEKMLSTAFRAMLLLAHADDAAEDASPELIP